MTSTTVISVPQRMSNRPGAYRLQLLCQLILHGSIGAFLIFGVCTIAYYLTVVASGLAMDELGILSIASCLFICMIVLGLCGIHDCTVEVALRVRRIRGTFRHA